MIKYGWHEILKNKNLLTNSSKTIFTEMMAFLKRRKRTAQHGAGSEDFQLVQWKFNKCTKMDENKVKS